MVQQEITVQDGQSAILEAGNFTNAVAICQVEMACFFGAVRYFNALFARIAFIGRDRGNEDSLGVQRDSTVRLSIYGPPLPVNIQEHPAITDLLLEG